jgi:DNA-binding transcriptional regulator YiaG
MKKMCPDLVGLDDKSLIAFWQEHRVAQLKRLGDRLLAESLPRYEPRDSAFYPNDLAARRQGLNLSLSEAAVKLGVNPVLLAAWESGEVRPPASLGLIYQTGL